MNHRRTIGLLLVLLLGLTLVGVAQPSPQPIRVLVVDSTKTFLSTMRVGGLVGGLRGTGLFEIDVRLSNVAGAYQDPLDGEVRDEDIAPYDLILWIPRGIDDATASHIWVVSNGPTVLSPQVNVGLRVCEQVINQAFAPMASAAGVYDDLFPAFLWALYVQEGWMNE